MIVFGWNGDGKRVTLINGGCCLTGVSWLDEEFVVVVPCSDGGRCCSSIWLTSDDCEWTNRTRCVGEALLLLFNWLDDGNTSLQHDWTSSSIVTLAASVDDWSSLFVLVVVVFVSFVNDVCVERYVSVVVVIILVRLTNSSRFECS